MAEIRLVTFTATAAYLVIIHFN